MDAEGAIPHYVYGGPEELTGRVCVLFTVVSHHHHRAGAEVSTRYMFMKC